MFSQIHEIAPESLEDLPVGLRVCAFWSAKYTYLFPGTVGDPAMIDKKLGPGYVNVELDDGDSRDIHYKDIRYLPPDYPIVGESVCVVTWLRHFDQS